MNELPSGIQPIQDAETRRSVPWQSVRMMTHNNRDIGNALQLLGGKKVFPDTINEAIEVHDVLLQGLPFVCLTHLFDNLSVICMQSLLEKAVGMSIQTFQRHKNASKPLNQAQSGRAWKFALILSQATTIFGTQAEAESWMEHPATGLNQRRPIDLLATVAGIEIIEQFFERLESGVYA